MTIELLKKAEILAKHHPSEKATTLNNLACYYRRLGKLHAAMTCLKRALEIEKRLENVRNAADTHLNICAVLSQLGKHEQALEQAQEALITLQEDFFAAKQLPSGANGTSPSVQINNTYDGALTAPQSPVSSTSQQQVDRVAVMCIAYHNIGVEQEFLKDYANSVASYKKGVGLAEQYLGVDHAIATTVRNSYLAAKRTIAAKPGGGRHRPGSVADAGSSVGPRSPGKVPLRLLASPRSGGSSNPVAATLRLPSPLTKERQRRNFSDIPTPRSIVAEALSRGSTLPPLELVGSASSPGRGLLSPRDPFFSPRFRFDVRTNDTSATTTAGGASGGVAALSSTIKEKKKKNAVKFQVQSTADEEELAAANNNAAANSTTRRSSDIEGAKTSATEGAEVCREGVLDDSECAFEPTAPRALVPPSQANGDFEAVDDDASAPLQADDVTDSAIAASGEQRPVALERIAAADPAEHEEVTLSTLAKLESAVRDPEAGGVGSDTQLLLEVDDSAPSAADRSSTEIATVAEASPRMATSVSLAEEASESHDKDDILGLLDESAGGSRINAVMATGDGPACGYSEVEAVGIERADAVEVHDTSESWEPSPRPMEASMPRDPVESASSECGSAGSPEEEEAHYEVVAATGGDEDRGDDAGTECLDTSPSCGYGDFEARVEGVDQEPPELDAGYNETAAEVGLSYEQWREDHRVASDEQYVAADHESPPDVSSDCNEDQASGDADGAQYPPNEYHGSDRPVSFGYYPADLVNEAAVYDAVDDHSDSRNESPDPQDYANDQFASETAQQVDDRTTNELGSSMSFAPVDWYSEAEEGLDPSVVGEEEEAVDWQHQQQADYDERTAVFAEASDAYDLESGEGDERAWAEVEAAETEAGDHEGDFASVAAETTSPTDVVSDEDASAADSPADAMASAYSEAP